MDNYSQDKGNPPLSSVTNLTLYVQDMDDQNPAFLYDSYSATLPTNGNTKLNILPQDLKAVDKDLNLTSPVFYSFAGIATKVVKLFRLIFYS